MTQRYVTGFEPYQGAKATIKEDLCEFGLCPYVTLQYPVVLKKLGNYPYNLFFDNFFTTIPLLTKLHSINIRGILMIKQQRRKWWLLCDGMTITLSMWQRIVSLFFLHAECPDYTDVRKKGAAAYITLQHPHGRRR